VLVVGKTYLKYVLTLDWWLTWQLGMSCTPSCPHRRPALAGPSWLTTSVMSWLKLANDVFSDRFSCLPIYGVTLDQESESFHFSFFKVLARRTRLTLALLTWIYWEKKERYRDKCSVSVLIYLCLLFAEFCICLLLHRSVEVWNF
jgi:hypothetical protein